MGRGVIRMGRSVGRKVVQTKEWNVERRKRAKKKRDEDLEKRKGTIALEAIE